MIRSLLIKAVMLAVTLGAMLWIGSVTPVRHVPPPARAAVSTPSSTLSQPVSSETVGHLASTPPVESPAGVSPDLKVETAERSSPGISEVAASTARDATARPLDLNHATAADLESLPGIGPKLAQRVIDYRAARGPFRAVEELRQVKGIGKKTLDRVRPHVLVVDRGLSAQPKGAL